MLEKFQYFSDDRSWLNKISFIVLIALIGNFLVHQYMYSGNRPFALDDARMYLLHFQQRFLDSDSLIERIAYFFSETNYPHTKFTGRVVAYLYYLTTGEVNFKFLIMFGSLMLVAFLFIAKRIFGLSFFFVLPLAIILFAIDFVGFWVGPMTGFPFLLIYAPLVFYCLSKDKIILAGFIAFVASFTHSPGIFVFLAAFPLFLIAPNNSMKKRLLWICMFMITAFMYWYLVLSQNDLARLEESRSLGSIIKCLPSLVAYEGQFLSMPVLGLENGKSIARHLPVVGVTIALSVLFSILATVYAKRKAFTAPAAISLAFVFFCLMPGPISAFVNDNCASTTDLVPPRYLMYALMAWVGIYLFAITNAKKHLNVVIAIIFIAAFLPKYFYTIKKGRKSIENKEYSWVQRLTVSEELSTEVKIMKSANNIGIYTNYFPSYPILHNSNGIATESLEDFWYIFDITEDYCNVEVILKISETETVEIWVGDGGNSRGFIPRQFHINRLKKRNSQYLTPAEQKRFNRSYNGYVFLTEDKSCESGIRLKVGNRISTKLKTSNVSRN